MRKKVRSAYLLESLEARLLFSADLAPLPVDGGTTGAEFESDLEMSLQPDSAGVQEAGESTQERQEVIFVDSGVDDYQKLIDDIESQLKKGRQFDIVNLESDSDGIDQISAYLRQHEDIDAVHVVSHGSENAVKLGNIWLTPDKLDAYADAIEGWQQTLSGDADLLFYGCNIAAGAEGQELVNSLTLLTGADVAASDDATGSAQFGGDWDLEYSKGEIETTVAFSPEIQQNWNSLLTIFTVNTTADTIDDTPGDGNAEDAAGNTSLRAAIMEANALGGAHEIILNPGTYTLSLGELEITSDLTINGADARTTLIDGNGSDRVFKIDGNSTATLTGITIMNGNQNNSGGVFVENGSTLELSDAIVRDNTSNMGGGIHVHGAANLERVLLYNNTANEGGGIHFHGADGGSLINVTISDNDATVEGGGLWTDSAITVTNCTITLNDAPNGGGIVNSGGIVNISNTIVAENLASSDPDVEGTFNSQDNNLIGDKGTASGFIDGVNGDQVGTSGSPIDPLLGSLQHNGGFTRTHALLTGSPAIDPAGLSGAPPYDQRGFVRDVAPDIGAFEYNGANTAPTLTVTGAATVKKGTVFTLNLSASDPDSHTITSWTINWGDGTIETIPGNPSSVTHTYTQAGFTYNITVSATDVTGTYIAGDLISTSFQNDRIYWFDANNPLINTWEDLPGFGNSPVDVQIGPDGEIYVTGYGSDKIFRYNADGSFDTTFVDGNGLNAPSRMAFGPDGNLYVTNMFTNEVLRFSGVDGTSNGIAMGAFISTNLNQPDGITFGPDGNLYVGNRGTGDVLRFDGVTGALDPTFTANGLPGYMDIQFGPDGLLWVTNQSSNDIRRYSATDGAYIDTFASTPTGATDFAGIAFGPDGYVYMSDAFDNDKIIRYPIGDGSAPEPFVLSGTGGLDQPVNIVFTPAHQVKVVANNAPTATNLTTTSSYNEGDGTVDITDIVVTDVDSGDTITATLTLNDTTTGSLSANNGATYDGGTGIWTITDTVANVNLALANLVFLPNSDNDVDTTITTHIEDAAGAGPANGTITLDVIPANDAPVINDSAFSVDENTANGTLVGTVAATDSGPADNFTMLYWVDLQTDELRRINLDGTGNEQLVIQADGTAATGLRSVAVDDVNGKVYWVNNNSDQIWRANLDGSNPEQLLSGIGSPMGIAVDAAGAKIYWFDYDARDLWWADLDGANAAALITAGINQPKALAIDASGGKLYWTDNGLNTIMRANLDGSNIETVVAGLDDPYGIALDTTAGKVYWAEPTIGEIQRADMVVGATAETVITGLSEPRAVTVDTINGKLYYANAGADRIERANIDGSSIEIVTATGDWPTGLSIGPPLQNLTYAITGGNTNGAFTIDSVTGAITVANSSELDFETTPVFNLTITVTDAGGLADSATITINLNDLNETPVINDATFNIDENTTNGTAVGNVPVTDPDAGDTHVYTITAGNTGSAFAIDNSGNITVANSSALNFETTPVFTLTVEVQDLAGTGLTDTATITVNLNDLNETPVINDATFNIDENTTNGTAVGNVPVTDPDAGDTHVYTITAGNTGSAFAIDNSGNITVANSAALNFETTPVFTLTVEVQDLAGTGLTDTATITVNLNDLNETPVINDATFNIDENTTNGTAVGNVPVTDPDAGDTHVYTITAGNTGSAFAIDNSGNITVANSSALNFETTPVFTLTVEVQDLAGTGLTDTATITVNLNDLNETPVINDATFNIDENTTNGTAVGNVPVTDPDAGDSHVYSITAGNTGTAFAIDNSGNITVANSSALNFETTPVFTLTVQVRDQGGTGLTDTATITVNLNDINDAPVINNATFNLDENSTNGTAVGSVPVTDPDAGDTHVYSITTGNTGTAFAIDNSGNITVANSAAVNFETTPVFTLTVQVRDQGGTGLTDTATITVNLNDLNETPVINDATFNIDENTTNGTAVGNVPVTDPDAGDTHVYTITAGNTGSAFAIDNSGNITVANSSALNFETTPVFTLTVEVQDLAGTGLTDTATITVNLNDLNETPVINDATFNIDENTTNGTAVGNVPVTDPDAGDSHVYSITAGNTGTAFAIDNSGNITVANSSALNFETTPVFTLTVQVRDQGGTGLTDTATITVNLNDINDAPVINNATFNLDENSTNGTAVGSVPVTDPDAGDTHVYSITTGNTGTAFAIDNSGNITVANSAAVNFETTPVFTLTVQVRDQGGTGLTDTATITVNLNDLNETPVINDATFNIDENTTNGTAVGNVPVTDPDAGDTHVYSITAGNTGTAFAIDNSGNIMVANSSALNFETTPVFTLTVQVRDQGGTGLTDTATITVNLNNINDTGTVTIDNTTPAQGDTLTANVIDPDGVSGAITYQWFNDGILIGGATGKTYTTTQGNVGAVMMVTAIYTDDQGTAESLTSAPTAPVTDVNDTPIAVNDNLNAIEDQSMTFTSVTDLLGNDSDIDGDTLTISSFSQPANGSLVDNGDGTVTYTSAGNFNGVDSFTYTISDSNGGTASGAAIIVVTPVGDTPQVTNVSTDAEVQSGLINIDRNPNDGAEVTHFKISDITNGTLYLADGVTRIDNGNFITVGQGQAGLRFTPAANSIADGSFNVESSEDGVLVSSQSDIATSIISILTTAPQPSEPVPSPTPSDPEEVISEETEQEENEELEDVADETDVPAIADDMASVEAPQNAKAPGLKKASMVPGISVFRQADLNSNNDRIPGRSTFLSPQTLKKLVESENLGELKTALRKLDITTLPPDVYALVRGSLDAVQEEMGKEILIGKTVVGSAIATSVGLSAGYVVWMLKGGSLLASVLSSLPAWQLADPLAILVGKIEDEEEEEEDDTLETIIKDGSRRNKDKESKASESDKHKKESTKR